MIKCDSCMNSRPVVSENGIHFSCSLSQRKATQCLIGLRDNYAPLNKEDDKYETNKKSI